jgi:hypothetical protein
LNVPKTLKVDTIITKIRTSCAQKNAIRKGEKFYFKYAMLKNLFSITYSKSFLSNHKSQHWDALVTEITKVTAQGEQGQTFFCIFLHEYANWFTNSSNDVDDHSRANAQRFLKKLTLAASHMDSTPKTADDETPADEKLGVHDNKIVYEFYLTLHYCLSKIGAKGANDEKIMEKCKNQMKPNNIVGIMTKISGDESYGPMSNILVYDLICSFVAASMDKRLPKL